MKQLTANVLVETGLKGANHGVVTTSDLAQATVWLSVYGGEKRRRAPSLRRIRNLAALETRAEFSIPPQRAH